MPKVSAMVVGLNEEKHLKKCLPSLSFCSEIVYADLGSKDGSVEYALSLGVKIVYSKIQPSGEYTQSEIVFNLENDWVIFLDPDEVIDTKLADEINLFLSGDDIPGDIGGLLVPWKFYFKGKPLNGTVWGGENYKYLLVNRLKFEFNPVTHSGRRVKAPFKTKILHYNLDRDNVIHHYWMVSSLNFITKHFRYLKKDGYDRYNQGARVSFWVFLSVPFKAFYLCFIIKKGYLDKCLGFYLSLFWAFYETVSHFQVLLMQLIVIFKVPRNAR